MTLLVGSIAISIPVEVHSKLISLVWSPELTEYLLILTDRALRDGDGNHDNQGYLQSLIDVGIVPYFTSFLSSSKRSQMKTLTEEVVPLLTRIMRVNQKYYDHVTSQHLTDAASRILFENYATE